MRHEAQKYREDECQGRDAFVARCLSLLLALALPVLLLPFLQLPVLRQPFLQLLLALLLAPLPPLLLQPALLPRPLPLPLRAHEDERQMPPHNTQRSEVPCSIRTHSAYFAFFFPLARRQEDLARSRALSPACKQVMQA